MNPSSQAGAGDEGVDDASGPGSTPEKSFDQPDVEATEQAPVDPWAHRRGEPRVFAMLWTLYVLIAVAGSVLWLATTGQFTATGYGPAARIMLMVLMAGVVLVWPMTRLSQLLPEDDRVVSAIYFDILVVLTPVQLVIWPLVGLAGWPWVSVAAVSVTFIVWAALSGGLLAAALSGEVRTRAPSGALARAGWMLVIVAIVGPVPLLAGTVSPAAWMLSPFAMLRAITGSGVGGVQARWSQPQMLLTLGVGAIAIGLWIWASVRERQAWGR